MPHDSKTYDIMTLIPLNGPPTMMFELGVVIHPVSGDNGPLHDDESEYDQDELHFMGPPTISLLQNVSYI
jgi:hypothetical protein